MGLGVWVVCAFVIGVFLCLLLFVVLIGVAFVGVLSLIIVVIGVHWFGVLFGVVVFVVWCGWFVFCFYCFVFV